MMKLVCREASPAHTDSAPPPPAEAPDGPVRCHKVCVTLTRQQHERVRADVAAGRATSYSEAVRALLADGQRWRAERGEQARRERQLEARLSK